MPNADDPPENASPAEELENETAVAFAPLAVLPAEPMGFFQRPFWLIVKEVFRLWQTSRPRSQ